MSDIKVRIGAQPAIKVLSTGAIPTLFTKLFDVDASILQDGAIAVYHADNQKFTTQRDLNLDNLTVTNLVLTNIGNIVLEVDGGMY